MRSEPAKTHLSFADSDQARGPRIDDRWPDDATAGPAVLAAMPRPLTSFVGREAEVSAALALLGEGGVRLLTLTGPGGVGKTRVALQIAAAAATGYPDGVAFVPLAPIRDPELVLPAIARVLGLREAGGGSVRELVTGFLQRKRILLVLDNFEQVRPAAAALASLLAACPGIAMLVTSRVLLRVAGEQRFAVAPLPLPNWPTGAAPAEPLLAAAAASPAIKLFLARARAVDHRFTLDDDNVGAIAHICRQLDGLPLALELAAARLRCLTPSELAERLDPPLLLLTEGPVDAPVRLRTMRDAIGWSYDLLSADEQTAFRRLAVFVGGFTLEAAAGVVATASVGHAVILGHISALVDASLVERLDGDSETRFAMLETIREFGGERLVQSGEWPEIAGRHASWYLGFAERMRRDGAHSQGRGLTRLAAEQPNFRAALAWFQSQGEPAQAMRLAAHLAEFWMRRGYLSEGRSWLVQALAGDGGAPSAARAEALVGLNMLLWSSGDLDRCDGLLDAAEATAAAVGDAAALAFVRLHQGYVAAFRNDLDKAADRGEEALVSSHAIPQRYSQHGALWLLARVAIEREDDDGAVELHEQLLASARANGDEISQINALYDLAALAARRNAFDRALAGYTEAADICLAIGDRFHASLCLNRVAVCAVALGQPEAAVRTFATANRLRDEVGATTEAFSKELESHGRALADARAALGEERFGALWRAGLMLPAPAAIADAADLSAAVTAATGTRHMEAHVLTPREQDVLRLLVAGRADKEIAAELAIGRRTVSNHVSVILDKLGVTSRTAAAVVAVRDGLI